MTYAVPLSSIKDLSTGVETCISKNISKNILDIFKKSVKTAIKHTATIEFSISQNLINRWKHAFILHMLYLCKILNGFTFVVLLWDTR